MGKNLVCMVSFKNNFSFEVYMSYHLHVKYTSYTYVFQFQSRPYFDGRRKYEHMVDPLLQGHFPVSSLHEMIYMTAMCLREEPKSRPRIGEIVATLEFLASRSYP